MQNDLTIKCTKRGKKAFFEQSGSKVLVNSTMCMRFVFNSALNCETLGW